MRASVIGLLLGGGLMIGSAPAFAQGGSQTFESACAPVFRNAGCEALLGRTRAEIEAQFGVGIRSADNAWQEYLYPAQGVVLRYENDILHTYVLRGFPNSSTGSEAYKGKPAQGLEWGASEPEIIARLGPPSRRDATMSPIYLMYGEYIFQLGFEDELVQISNLDTMGLQARRNQDPAYLAASAAAAADQMKGGQRNASADVQMEAESLVDSVAANVNVANNIIRELDAERHLGQLGVGVGEREMKKDEVRKLQAESIGMIDAFLKKYQGRLPEKVLSQLASLREQVSAGGIGSP